MFLKQYNFKPRSNSQSSGTDTNTTASSPPQDNNTNSTTTAAMQGRRRSSATEKFAGLTNYKRGSQDQTVQDKKAIFAEQNPNQGGVLGGMWNSFTKGS